METQASAKSDWFFISVSLYWDESLAAFPTPINVIGGQIGYGRCVLGDRAVSTATKWHFTITTMSQSMNLGLLV